MDRADLLRRIEQEEFTTHSNETTRIAYGDRFAFVKRSHSAKQLQREQRILQQVRGKGIPAILEHFTHENYAYLLQEVLPGVPLTEHIDLTSDWKSRRLDISEIRRIITGLALCFTHIHNARLLYRDLDLRHILVSDDQINLVDLEWCIPMNQYGSGIVDNKAGTWETMAPEEFNVGNVITIAANTYTLGVVLAQLLEQKNRFFVPMPEGVTLDAAKEETRLLHEQKQLFSFANTALNQFLARSLDPEPTSRFQTISEFVYAFDSL